MPRIGIIKGTGISINNETVNAGEQSIVTVGVNASNAVEISVNAAVVFVTPHAASGSVKLPETPAHGQEVVIFNDASGTAWNLHAGDATHCLNAAAGPAAVAATDRKVVCVYDGKDTPPNWMITKQVLAGTISAL